MRTIEFSDAYVHVEIAEDFCEPLNFVFRSKFERKTAMLFGLSLSARFSTTILHPV